MVKVLLIMHHIALCIPYIALVHCGHLLHMRVDHVEPKSEFQVEQDQAKDFTNLALDQGKPQFTKPPSLSLV
jgi:hypothetical protein